MAKAWQQVGPEVLIEWFMVKCLFEDRTDPIDYGSFSGAVSPEHSNCYPWTVENPNRSADPKTH
jgi:hypothetical protein